MSGNALLRSSSSVAREGHSPAPCPAPSWPPAMKRCNSWQQPNEHVMAVSSQEKGTEAATACLGGPRSSRPQGPQRSWGGPSLQQARAAAEVEHGQAMQLLGVSMPPGPSCADQLGQVVLCANSAPNAILHIRRGSQTALTSSWSATSNASPNDHAAHPQAPPEIRRPPRPIAEEGRRRPIPAKGRRAARPASPLVPLPLPLVPLTLRPCIVLGFVPPAAVPPRPTCRPLPPLCTPVCRRRLLLRVNLAALCCTLASSCGAGGGCRRCCCAQWAKRAWSQARRHHACVKAGRSCGFHVWCQGLRPHELGASRTHFRQSPWGMLA